MHNSKRQLIENIKRVISKPLEDYCFEFEGKIYRPIDIDLRTFKPLKNAEGIEPTNKLRSRQCYVIGETIIYFG